MKTKYLFLKSGFAISAILFFQISSLHVAAQQTTENQQKALITNVTEFLGKYQQYSQFSTDGVKLDEDYIKEFGLLFDKKKFKVIYNDLALDGNNSFYSPEEYINFAKTHYPQGVDQSLNLDKLIVIESPVKNGYYRIIVKVKKQLTGLYGGYEIHSYDEDQYFLINVLETNLDKLSEYKINGVLSNDKFLKYIASRKSKGLYFGLSGGYDMTRIFSSPVYSSSIWKYKTHSSINPNIDLSFMFTNSFGLGTGFGRFEYGSIFTISEYDRISEATVPDIDGDMYNPVLQIPCLIESNTISCNEIPLMIKTRAGTRGLKFYFDFGVVYSIIRESYFTLDGSSVIGGYYPQYKVILNNIPEYGFGSFNYISTQKKEMTLNEHLTSARAAMGLSLNLGRSFIFRIGARITYGITDIGFNKVRHPNDFKNTLSTPLTSTILQSGGIEIGLSYKIL